MDGLIIMNVETLFSLFFLLKQYILIQGSSWKFKEIAFIWNINLL